LEIPAATPGAGRLYDITRPLCAGLAPWPGDTPFAYRLTWRMAAGASVNVGALAMSTHNGTHTDAPFHYTPRGAAIDTLDLHVFAGPAMVVDVSGAGPSITREVLAPAAEILRHQAPRLLLKTGAWPDDTVFPARIPVLAPDVPAWLASLGVRLLGLDVPSVDDIESRELPIHHALGAAGIQILESLDLASVPAGIYELIALPLKIAGGDAAPVRAILRAPVQP
jgi:arylformamidase